MRKTLLCLLAFGLAPAAWAAPLTLTFDPSGPVVSGATASGEVAWVGVARVPQTYFQEVFTVLRTELADATGVATLPLDAPAPRRSLWVAVDVTTGAFQVGTPQDFDFAAGTLTGAHLSFDAEGNATGLALPHARAEVLWVRPGVGAWSVEAVDALAHDTDRVANGAVALGLGSLSPLSSAAAPPALAAGDVLVVLDPSLLTVLAATVPASLLAAGGN